MSEIIEQRNAGTYAKIKRLEAVANWALTVQTENTDDWMGGMAAQINGVLMLDGNEKRRCFVDGDRLVLREDT